MSQTSEAEREFYHLRPDDPRAQRFVELLRVARTKPLSHGVCWAISYAGGNRYDYLYATSADAVALIRWVSSSLVYVNQAGETMRAAFVTDWLWHAHKIHLAERKRIVYRRAWIDHMIRYFGGAA